MKKIIDEDNFINFLMAIVIAPVVLSWVGLAVFLINLAYDKINQERSIQMINLNNVFRKDLIFSQDQIKNYFGNNKDKYTEVYKSLTIIELDPKKLTGNTEFNDLFFKKID